MSGAKLKLDSAFYFDDVQVWGLVCDLPAYRLCYFINNSLALELKRAQKDKTFVHKGTLMHYSLFEFDDEIAGLRWHLLANKNPWAGDDEVMPSQAYRISGLPLITSLKLMDYFLLIEGECSDRSIKNWQEVLKKMPQIRALEIIDPEKTKNLHHLLPY